jgi:hypothetical protein
MAGYSEGSLPIGRSRRFELHLELCNVCRSKAGARAVSKAAVPEPSNDSEFNRLRESLAVPEEVPARKKVVRLVLPKWWWVYAAGILVVAAVGAKQFFS